MNVREWWARRNSREPAQHQSIETPRTTMATKSKSVMRLASGQLVNVLGLTVAEVRYWDFAWALHQIVRFGGHSPVKWDVLSHSALVWGLAKRELGDKFTEDFALQAALLLHDAAEGYIGDIPRPLKSIPEYDFFKREEEKLERTIFRRFGLDYNKVDWETVKRYDNQALFIEMSVFFPDVRGTRFVPEASFFTEPPVEIMRRMLIPVKPADFATNLRYIIINLMASTGGDTSGLNELFAVPPCLAPYVQEVAEQAPAQETSTRAATVPGHDPILDARLP